jgi:hypothetical protein
MIGLLPLRIIMKINIDCTANLGDFANALPVISGISKYKNEKIHLIIRPEMRKFNGIKELLKYQPMIEDVDFSDDLLVFGDVMNLSSWTRMDQEDENRPVETCRYENWVNDNYRMLFEVDDKFELQVKDEPMEFTDLYIIGDRWNHPTIDTRRKTQVVKDGVNPDESKVHYLDYSKPIMENLNLIRYSYKPFITTFTGVGILADLMNKETIVCWDEDMRMWDGHPVEFDFKRHYYADRKSKLVHVKDVIL